MRQLAANCLVTDNTLHVRLADYAMIFPAFSAVGRSSPGALASSRHRTVDFAASRSTIREGMHLMGRCDRRHSLDEHCTRTNWETSMRKLIVAEHLSLDGV